MNKMAVRYSTNNLSVLQNRKIFFDANILIYLFWPSGSHRWENEYSTAFANILRQQNELLVDYIVISEIINRAMRLEYDKSPLKISLTFKQYRDSSEGQLALSDIHLVVKSNILNRFTVIGKAFSKTDILTLLTVDSLDFSDKAIILTCKENTCLLLTNDADYKSADIDIVTANPAILRRQ